MIPFITTFTGRSINLVEITPEDICIEDIAHSLACINRFNGHTRLPITVAQHSLWVSHLSSPNSLEGLLHDAAEAYVGDMTKWLKDAPGMQWYQAIERKIQKIICEVFDLPTEMTETVKWADKLTVRFEHEVGFGFASRVNGYEKLTRPERARLEGWRPLSWQEAETQFLLQYIDLKR